MSILLGSKHQTLKALSGKLKQGKVLPIFSFTVGEWRESAEAVIRSYRSLDWCEQPLIVRSSSSEEDTEQQSLAGHFHTELNVIGSKAFETAVSKVVGSMSGSDDTVLVQPMLENVRRCGVLFTAVQNTGAPYYVFNVDETSGSTDTVTSGESNDLSLYYLAKCTKDHFNQKFQQLPEWIQNLYDVGNELERLTGCTALDIEFAENETGEIFIFQVRPLVNINKDVADKDHIVSLRRVMNAIDRLAAPHPYLCGEKGIFGVMPDWNPAEIIGTKPKPLSLSLYKELITDSTWAYQRDNYGYRQLRSFPLLIDYEGLPYIDVRVSFNSFIPKDLPDELADKLVNYYLQRLTEQPGKHDKVEFDIIFSCYTFDIEERLRDLYEHQFSYQDAQSLKASLRKLTNSIIAEDGLWHSDLKKIEQLVEQRQSILSSELTDIEKVFWLIEDCKRYGTLPFAGLARAGFIAVQLLQSLRSIGAIDEKDYVNFMGSVNTVSKQMTHDIAALSQSEFLDKYGHLRPGTYDICSLRYDSDESQYFSEKSNDSSKERSDCDFSLSLEKLEKIQTLLNKHGINLDVLSLFRFIKGAIEGREYAKFVFTKSLSDVLEILAKLGDKYGYSRDDMAMFNITCIQQMYSSAANVKDVLARSIEQGKEKYKHSLSLYLPSLVVDSENALFFQVDKGEPNYITNKAITGEIRVVERAADEELSGKIVCIPAADPGYDWLFSHDIAGLVTQFGGANSHMAIRAAELGIPAVIGCGQSTFDFLVNKKKVRVDCASQLIEVIY